MKKRTLLTVVLAVLGLGGAAMGQGTGAVVAVFPVQGTNLSPGEVEAIGAVLAQSYSNCAGAPVVGPREAGEALARAGSPPAAAVALGVREYVWIDAVRLTEKISISAFRMQADGKPIFQARWYALSLDDMEQVGDRLACALVKQQAIEETLTPQNVTARETAAENRTFSEKIVGFKTCAVLPIATDGTMLSPAVGGQFDMRLESKWFFLEFGAGALIPASDDDQVYAGIMAELGGSVYLSQTSVSPYIGLGVSPRMMFTPNFGADITPYGQIGLMFMRESSTRLFVDFRAAQNLFPKKIECTDAWGNYDERRVYITEFSLQVGIGW